MTFEDYVQTFWPCMYGTKYYVNWNFALGADTFFLLELTALALCLTLRKIRNILEMLIVPWQPCYFGIVCLYQGSCLYMNLGTT